MANTESGLPSSSRRSLLAPFMEGPRPWLVLARNAIPVLGVFLLDWSANLIAFQLWFDGVTALGAMLAFQARASVKRGEMPLVGIPPRARLPVLVLAWLLVWLVLGIYYWFILLLFANLVFKGGLGSLDLGNPGILAALLFVLVSNCLEESRRGYEQMTNKQTRLELNWDLSLHVARGGVMLLVVFFLWPILLLGLALVLSYAEIYPMRTLRFLGKDSMLESANEERSLD